ncbi:MAG: hypothetical protein JSV89_13580 [Spirochaetaceae bacterium]|nr:MAG: hypothetical protein JSV89_13580 [Spirochaetaceae bacterium]
MNDRRVEVSFKSAAAILCLGGLLFGLSGCLGEIGTQGAGRIPGLDTKDLVFPEQVPTGSVSEQAFQVSEYAPVGNIPWQNIEGGVWFLFSEPVVPAGKLGKPATESEQLQIYPTVEGIYRWYGSRLLSFEPTTSLVPSTEYTAYLNKDLTSLAGHPLEGMNAFRFRTPALQLLSMEPSGTDVPPEACRELLLHFNFPVELATISRFIEVEAEGRTFAFTAAYAEKDVWEGADRFGDEAVGRSGFLSASALTVEKDRSRGIRLKIQEELPWDRDVTVRLLEGARPGEQNYGTDREQRLVFHTLEPFRLEYGEVYDWLPTIEAGLIFNHPIAEQDLRAYLDVGLPGYELGNNLEVYGNAVYLKNLPVEFESSFSIAIARGLKDIYDQALPYEETVQLEVGPAASYVSFRASGNRILEAGFPPITAVEFQNVLSGVFAAGKLSEPFATLPSGRFRDYGADSIPRNTRIFRLIDFSPFLDENGRGSVYARWRFQVPSWWSDEPYHMDADLRLQVSDIGLTSHIAYNRITLQVAALSSGEPLEGAEIILHGVGGATRRVRSNRSGFASVAFQAGELARFTAGSAENLLIEVRTPNDRLMFKPSDSPSHNWNLDGPFEAEAPRPITYLCSDRGIYRPGETVSFYGIDRNLQLGSLNSRTGGYTVELRQGWYGEGIHASVSGRLSPSGRFWGTLELPGQLEPDAYFLVYRRADGSHTREVPLRVAFFRRVNFSVDLSIPEGIRYIGEDLEARFSASYLGGGTLTQGRWNYWWARRPIAFHPPDPQGDYRGFRFGSYPEYGYYDSYDDYYEELSSAEGSLSGDGTVVAAQRLSEGRPGRIYEYTITATIEDIDRQAISRQAGASVFTSSLLIGARITDEDEQTLYFVGKQDPFTLQACLLEPEGRPYDPESGKSLKILGRLLRENWKMVRERSIGGRIDTRWVREEVEERSFTLQTAGRKDSRGRLLIDLELATEQVGAYIIELRGTDRQGRETMTRLDFYSTGSGNVLWQRYDESRIDLVADRTSYAPGESAKLLIKSPLEAGRYLLTVEREGILEERFLDLTGSTDMVEIPIKEQYLPIVYLTISSATGRSAPPPDTPDEPDLGKPRGCFGMLAVAVDTDRRRIELELESSQESYRPGTEAEITIRASRQGQPLEGVEITLVAADRGVLDLIDYHLPDPLSMFYDPYNYSHGVAHFDSRALLLDPVLWKTRDLPGGDKEGEELGDTAPKVRKDFRATAVFEPGLVTGADGRATLRFRLPDQLTTFRATAVAVKDDLFGMVEDEFLVQNPINVRTALPRGLRVGDEARAGVILTNLSTQTWSVTVSLQSDLLEIRDRSEKRISLQPGKSREVAFTLWAAREGQAALSFSVESEVLREHLVATLAVQRSVVREAFTIVGQTEGSVQEGLVVPEQFLGDPEEGLQITLDSTLASSLLEAIRFLEFYPHDCLEQRTSKLFAYILFDWMLDNEGSSTAATGTAAADRLQKELETLPLYQTPDGGMSFWQDPGYRRSNYYVSLRTAHLLHLAVRGGHDLPHDLDLQSLLEYLMREYPADSTYLQSYALWVLSEHGVQRSFLQNGLQDLQSGRGNIGVLEQTFMALAYDSMGDSRRAGELLEQIRGYLRVGTRSVTLTGSVGSWIYYGGQLQAKAALLLLYGQLEPRSQIAQALADDLLASTRKGYWQNTSNTGWILQAFADYIDTDQERGTEFDSRVQLGSEIFAPFRFSGVSREPQTLKIEPKELARLATSRSSGSGTSPTTDSDQEWLPLVFTKEGAGRLYYSATLRYALEASRVEARDEGIGLFTEILDTTGKPVEGSLMLGQVYKLHYVIYSSRDRDFLALRLPIPAGAETIDGSLATSQIVRGQEEQEDWHYGPVRRIYDDEVRFYYDTFYRGKREGSFLFRTTSPGTFSTPPATAELMYEEEVFGRTDGRQYRIEP